MDKRVVLLISSSSKVLDPMPAPLMSVERAFLRKKHFQKSVDRGMFYVWADKIGTVFAEDNTPLTDGNYMPCWTSCAKTYQVLGKWPETLWKQRKVTTEVYRRLLPLWVRKPRIKNRFDGYRDGSIWFL